MRRLLLLTLLVAATAGGEEPLTNADVLRLLKNNVPASVITAKIKTSATRFDLTTDAIVTLTKAGVPEAVLAAMLESKTPSTPVSARPTQATGPDMLKWKQECEKIGWPDYICGPGTPFLTFRKVIFYKTDVGADATGELTLTHPRLSGSSIGRTVFDVPWEDVTTFCAEFGPWRNMFYLQSKDGELRFDLGGNEDELSVFLRKIIASVKPEECPK
jgi:hypothetical protein